jgi:transcriptional regulator with XRE-family HTH domain
MASFGENLRRERELRGIDLREMADATKISIRFLQALEQDRVDILPGGIFPRAFVRQYAKYLGLDPERLVAEFVYAHGGETTPRKDSRAPVRVDQGAPRGLIIAGVVLGLLGLVGWKVRGQVSRSPQAATPSMAAPPATFAASAPPLAAGTMVLTVLARRSSWVEAKVDGTTVLNRVLKDGESQRLEARQEVLLSVGNAGGIAVTLNDRPLGPIGRDGEVKKGFAINAQTLPALLAAGAAASPPPAAAVAVSPRPRASRPPSPSPSPSDGILLIAPRPNNGFGVPALVPPTSSPSPSPRP